MASVTLDKVNKLYENGFHAVRDLDLEIADGEFLVLVGPSGCGKSTALRMVAGLEDISTGVHEDRRPGGEHPVAEGPRHRHGVPVVRAVPAHDGRRQHRLRPEDPEDGQGRDRAPGQEGRRHAGTRPDARPQAEAAVRWPAAAGGDGPGHRPRAAGLPDGRAAVEPGRQAPRADARRDRPGAARSQRHHAVRHARPDRGHDHGRPGRGDQGRNPAAGRPAAVPLRQPDQHLRRRVHRLAADEHGHGHDHPAGRRPRPEVRRVHPGAASRASSTITPPWRTGWTGTSPSASAARTWRTPTWSAAAPRRTPR